MKSLLLVLGLVVLGVVAQDQLSAEMESEAEMEMETEQGAEMEAGLGTQVVATVQAETAATKGESNKCLTFCANEVGLCTHANKRGCACAAGCMCNRNFVGATCASHCTKTNHMSFVYGYLDDWNESPHLWDRSIGDVVFNSGRHTGKLVRECLAGCAHRAKCKPRFCPKHPRGAAACDACENLSYQQSERKSLTLDDSHTADLPMEHSVPIPKEFQSKPLSKEEEQGLSAFKFAEKEQKETEKKTTTDKKKKQSAEKQKDTKATKQSTETTKKTNNKNAAKKKSKPIGKRAAVSGALARSIRALTRQVRNSWGPERANAQASLRILLDAVKNNPRCVGSLCEGNRPAAQRRTAAPGKTKPLLDGLWYHPLRAPTTAPKTSDDVKMFDGSEYPVTKNPPPHYENVQEPRIININTYPQDEVQVIYSNN